MCVCHSGVHTAARKHIQILTDSYNPSPLNITCRQLKNLIRERRHKKKGLKHHQWPEEAAVFIIMKMIVRMVVPQERRQDY